MARSAGVKMDLRVFNNDGYALYPYHIINSYITKNGDSYDRYNLRMYEMLESSNIINIILCTYFANKQNNQYASNISHYYYMEDTISKFKF
jgi:NADH:ubiquinone oxidoreductase subunit D